MHVLVYGATGTTGTLIAESLRERGVPMVLSGRDPSRLDALAAGLGGVETRPAQVHDPASLRAAMAGARVVISCAGPFSRVGEPVVAAAIDSGVHYLDTSGEQAFMRDIYERYEARARKARVVVVSGMAFRIALGDLGAHLAAQALLRGDAASGSMAGELLDMADYPADEIIVAYSLDRLRTSAGTRLSALTGLTLPAYLWVGDRWVPVAPAAEHRRVSFGGAQGECDTLSFPSGEVITVPRHAPARRVQTYVSLAETGPIAGLVGRVAPAVGPLVGALLRSPLGAYAYSRASADQAAPSDTDRAFTRFAVLAEARRGFARQRVLIRGADPYGLTAAIAGYAAERILAMDEVSAGVRAPAEVFDPAAALAGMAERWPLVVDKSF